MIVAENQQELDKIACPACGQRSLKLTDTFYSAPLTIKTLCKNCGSKETGQGHPVKVLTTEEHIRKRPEMYLGCDNPEWNKLAEQVIADREAST